ncbi:efflux RND transporter periplasmic adaptor subunit [Vibrio parahaemolyticus]|uniref:efflux RND transporter periplasmic adaptor subunit n=1 Tax=Vibrio parahaemolyticus TaxID=670 RepID=UPI001A8FF2B4|nr:efflux RND transporter periplasmic adaptor subunit [Vibrio parahaemolyticus]MBO0170010.1 efflux RND transporter periplasmic adaptor subunit [Vibrio parahaemolyticus]MDF4755362.1 efflux RND transporter periplasmic adaptor subunit [Vibrio parahaemolyticus]MDF4781529.1 efflux RND transporter periplasmic adaptor subunit [Vibrio parahaemolyticus]MDF4786414.1 efflux RND transporter periplasmic adaptor subunit [Vibrio parahaemolyticus]MDF4796754.1 efflux RND transporter periplasmic adaptor subunit
MLAKPIVRWLLPFVVVGGSYAGYAAIAATAPEKESTKETITEPTVRASSLFPTDHKVVITSHGELVPFEKTYLSAQVSGEVISWHPNFVTGGIVKRGEVLFTIESDNYEAAVLQAEAGLASARASLIEEQAKAEVAKRQAKKLSDKQVTDLYLRKPQVLSAQAQVKSAQAALKRANRDLENCRVVAPYDALVVERDVGVGQFVTSGSRVATLNNIEVAEVHVPIAGFDSAFLPESIKELTATVTQQGILSTTREGKVVRDLGMIDSATRMINMVIQVEDPYGIDNQQPPIKFGSYVEVSFTGKELKHIYRLPQELVKNRTVWVVNDENQLQPRIVTVLRAEGEFMLVGEGLEQSDQLVLTLPEYPQKGMAVQIAKKNDDSETVVQ